MQNKYLFYEIFSYRRHGVYWSAIDQRSDELESVEEIRRRLKPALDYFSADRLILTSECGFRHVPIDVTHAKLKRLVEASKAL